MKLARYSKLVTHMHIRKKGHSALFMDQEACSIVIPGAEHPATHGRVWLFNTDSAYFPRVVSSDGD